LEKKEEENSEMREWIEEDEDKMDNIIDPYYKL